MNGYLLHKVGYNVRRVISAWKLESEGCHFLIASAIHRTNQVFVSM